MLKRLVADFLDRRGAVSDSDLIFCVVLGNSQGCGFIRKGQEQLMCDHLWLELLEQRIIN